MLANFEDPVYHMPRDSDEWVRPFSRPYDAYEELANAFAEDLDKWGDQIDGMIEEAVDKAENDTAESEMSFDGSCLAPAYDRVPEEPDTDCYYGNDYYGNDNDDGSNNDGNRDINDDDTAPF